MIRRGLFLIVVLLALASSVFSQGVRHDDIVWQTNFGITSPVPNATVRVCNSGSTGTPCSPLASIYSDPALTQVLANPTTANAVGAYVFYAAAGTYDIQTSGTSVPTATLQNVPLPCIPGATGCASGGGTIGGSCALNEVAVGSGTNTIACSTHLEAQFTAGQEQVELTDGTGTAFLIQLPSTPVFGGEGLAIQSFGPIAIEPSNATAGGWDASGNFHVNQITSLSQTFLTGSTATFNGGSSGSASVGAASVAGNPCTIIFPIASPTAGQFLSSAAPVGSPGTCQTSWSSSSGNTVFPVTVSGLVNSGGIPCFNSTTNEQTSTLLAANTLMFGGGVGACPTTGNLTGDVTTGGSSLTTLATVNSNVGSFANANVTVNAKGLITAVSNGSSGNVFAWGGSGFDGVITADGSTTYPCLGAPGTHNGVTNSYQMVYDCNATTFVVNAGVSILFQQTRIFATGSITVSGTLRSSSTVGGNGGAGGSTGTGGTGGTAPVPDVFTSGSTYYSEAPVGCLWSGSSVCSNTLYIAGVAGGAGHAAANGSGGTVGTNGVAASISMCQAPGVAGASGGNGGSGSSFGGGSGGGHGAGGVCTPLTPGANAALSLPTALFWGITPGNGTYSSIGYGSSNGYSGGGAGAGGDGTVAGGGGGGAGATGGNGNQIILSAPSIIINSTGVLSADGSNGGSGGNGGSPATGNAGGGGGGGGGDGGNGGVIVLVYHSYTNNGFVHANAGTGGAFGTGGTPSGSGTSGANGVAGNNGVNGLVFQLAQ